MLHIVSLKGRINRKKYILSYLLLGFLGLIIFGTTFTIHLLMGEKLFWILYFLFLLFGYLVFVITVKRLHDINWPTWLGIIILLSMKFEYSSGDAHVLFSPIGILLPFPIDIIIGIATFVIFVILLFKRGDIGPNKYGANPLATMPITPVAAPIQQPQNPTPEPVKIV